MAFVEKIKKTFSRDLIVIAVIVVLALVLATILGRKSYEWTISNREKLVSGEEILIGRSVIVSKGGKLVFDDSEVLIDAEDYDLLGFYVSGDSDLEIKKSTIDGDDSFFSIISTKEDNSSPSITVEDSKLENNLGIYLADRSELEAKDSDLGKVLLHDKSKADITGSTLIPVFVSDGEEKIKDLQPGDDVDYLFDSNEGWSLNLEECDIDEYQIMLKRNADVELMNSKNVILGLIFESEEDDDTEYNVDIPISQDTGSYSQDDYSIKWSSSWIQGLNIVSKLYSNVSVVSTPVREMELSEYSKVKFEDLSLSCDVCMVGEYAEAEFDNISIEKIAGDPTLIVYGRSKVVFKDSDIRTLHIILKDAAALELENCQYDNENIDEYEQSSVEFTD
ncbi:hypothetical protein JW710_02725 [Candidatus Dojkabacteria bacterium]|nr:hypothetical protein [Candidatus Dojkabacteria bacterium]